MIGFVDDDPRRPIPGLGPDVIRLLGEIDHLPALVKLLDVERVIVTFTHDPIEHSLDLIRTINELGVQVDIVPRLLRAARASDRAHTVESIPLWALPPLRLAPSSRAAKRALDVVGADTWAPHPVAAAHCHCDRDQDRLARPGALPPDPRRRARPRVPDLEVPVDDRRRGFAEVGGRPPEQAPGERRRRTDVQDRGGSALHARRATSCAGRRSTSYRSSSTSCSGRCRSSARGR